MKTFLHVGCGNENKSDLFGFNNDKWKEIRLDIDKKVNPDIVGSLIDMKSVETGSVDAVYSSHNIEHIFPHEVRKALREFYRVLKNNGIVIITCPDIQSVGEAVAQDKLHETLYESPIGPVTAFDILYGHRKTTSDGNIFMIHKGGFTYSTLDRALYDAGFETRCGARRTEAFDLYLVAFKQKKSEEEVKKIAVSFIPGAEF